MQTGGITNSAQMDMARYAGARLETRAQDVAPPSLRPVDRYEPSEPIMGAANTLPGQVSSQFEVTGEFGFCQNCSSAHGLSTKGDGEREAPKINGTEIPDLHAVLGADDGSEVPADSDGDSSKDAVLKEEAKRDELTGDVELSPEEQQEVEELKRRDQEVRTHEHAHVAAGGQHVRGGISYEYQTGPDGKRYAVGGEVSIDTSPESDPEDTIRKAQTIRQAALAPAEPSAQDRRAASAAAQMEMKARQEMAQAELDGEGEDVEAVMGNPSDTKETEDSSSTQARTSVDKTGSDGKAQGLPEPANVTPPEAPQKPDGVGGLEGIQDKGLPEVASSATTPPVVRLDYGVPKHAGGMVDMYG